jgi:Predicted dehydrogenases and related proteins
MLNVAIAGAGLMGRVHCDSYENVRGAKVAAVFDEIEDIARLLAEKHDARAYYDFDKMLEQEKIDIVDICLPTYLHKEFVIKAVNKKINVFCEKPIALKLEDAMEMLGMAENNKVKFSIGQVVRFFPAYNHAIKLIENGEIGTPKLIRTTRTGAFPTRSTRNWYADPTLSGGVLLDLVIHDFDWIRYNFGKVKRVYARNLLKDSPAEIDHCMVTLRLESGMIAHVEGSWAYPQGSVFGTTFEIIGTKGQIEFDSRGSAPLKKHLQVGGAEKIVYESPYFSYEEPYTAELQEYVNSILEDREPAVRPEDAIKSLEISLAAVQSSLSREVVTLGGERA